MHPGTRLGPYRVDSLIGTGGMGEVYLGVDTRLDRQVAIKVLSRQLARDAALRERFEREARTISSLSHPNICTLFDLGQHDGSEYLVMEYLQGETLADRIARGALSTPQVIRVSLGIAHALEAAHRQGIVHRDLKPGNVMLTKSGVKLLDFGLAKLNVTGTQSSPVGTTVARGATEVKPLTEQGAILGTFQYMAPEQLEGHAIDARADLFALGAMIYEMATGRRAFEGTSKASLIAAILQSEPPPMTEIQPLTPPALERIVRALLAKDPDERIQTAHDVALELKWLGESSSQIEAPGVRRKKRIAPWIAAAACALLAIGAAAMWWRERTKAPPAYSFSILPPPGYEFRQAAISPDGALLAMALWERKSGAVSLWTRRVDDGTERQIATGIDTPVFWSPDAQWIGFVHPQQRLMRVRVEGGQPETICRTSVQGQPEWNRDGTILFTPRWGAGVSRVAASGGEPSIVTTLDAPRRESVHVSPLLLPDGNRFLYIARTIAEHRNELWAGSLDGAKPVRVATADALVGYAKPYLLTVRDGAIYAQRFDPDSLRFSGEPQRVLDGIVFNEAAAEARVSMAAGGALVYVPLESTRFFLNAYDRSGAATTLWQGDNIFQFDLSADGRTLVVVQAEATKGAGDVHAIDLVRGVATRLTGGLAAHALPAIAPGCETVMYQSDSQGFFDIYARSIVGASPERVLWKDDRDKTPHAWTPDGKHVIVSRWTAEQQDDVWVVPVDGGKPWLLLGSEQDEDSVTISADGHWIAYTAGTGDEVELYVRPFPQGRAIGVSSDGGGLSAWRADGRELIWTAKGNRVMSVALDLTGPRPQVGTPRLLFTVPRTYTRPRFARDGRILMVVPDPAAEGLTPLRFTSAWRMKAERADR